MRHELHEFGPFTVELWEAGDKIKWTMMDILHGNHRIRTCREPVTLEAMKQDAKIWLVSATARWQSQAKDWDQSHTSTSA